MSLAASHSTPSRPPHITNTVRAELGPEVDRVERLARARAGGSAGSLAVNAPSLNTGCEKRFVVAIGTCMPGLVERGAEPLEDLLALRRRSTRAGSRSSSWKLTPYAPSSASRCTVSTGSSGGRVSWPKGSRPRFPTVQSPKVK